MEDSIFSQNRDLLGNLISENSEIGIVIGEPHSLDKVAAALSLYLTFKEIGRDVQIVTKKDPIVEFSNLVGIDKIKKEFTGLTKTFTISLPYNEGEIEKVSYKIEGDKLNINLFAGDKKMSFAENEIQYIKRGAVPSLIFAVSVSDPERLYSYFDSNSDVKLVNIDNNQMNDAYGDVAYVSPNFSSLSEVVAKTIQDLALPMNQDIAQNLLDGVTISTENFTTETTSPYAFEAVSFLMRHGAKRKSMQEVQEKKRKSFGIPVTPMRNEAEETNSNEEAPSDDVPRDWFAPKVFKGTSKKQE
jgi:hypothetical protein